jgi:DUF971 family protein
VTAPPLRPLAVHNDVAAAVLDVTWDEQRSSRLPHAWLRRQCRCASCRQWLRTQGEPAPVASDLRLNHVMPMADLGLNLGFSDGHARGVYPWAYLLQLSLSQQEPPAAA